MKYVKRFERFYWKQYVQNNIWRVILQDWGRKKTGTNWIIVVAHHMPIPNMDRTWKSKAFSVLCERRFFCEVMLFLYFILYTQLTYKDANQPMRMVNIVLMSCGQLYSESTTEVD